MDGRGLADDQAVVMPMHDPLVYLNGEFIPLSEATVSVLDRGFLFGDGVYEVIPVYGGKPFRLDDHLRRLDNSLSGIRLPPPLTHAQWQEIIHGLLQGQGDQSVYLQVTRGVAPKRDHAFPKDGQPTVLVMVNPMETGEPQAVKAILVDDIRWQWCHIKAITLLANVLLRQQAIDRGCHEAILVRDGKVTEGAASNVFAVMDGVLVTPPKGPHLLPGITRDVVLELAGANGIAFREEEITPDDLKQAEEIWLTSSTRELLPVIALDDQPVGKGRPGPLWEKMLGIFQGYKQSLRSGS